MRRIVEPIKKYEKNEENSRTRISKICVIFLMFLRLMKWVENMLRIGRATSAYTISFPKT
jgi:hypothetical protein